MGKPEAVIENYLKNQVKKAGGLCLKFISPGYSGVPDRIIIIPGGQVVFVEVKSATGKLTELQKAFGRRLEFFKAEYALVNSKESVNEFIDKYFWHLI